MSSRLAVALAALAAAGAVGTAPARADPLPPQIHTVAGGGSCTVTNPPATDGGYPVVTPCNGVKATTDPILHARAVATLPDGTYFFIDAGYDLVREVATDGSVTTVAGNGTATDAPDGSLAVDSGLNGPVAIAATPDGGLLITEFNGSVVRYVSPGGPSTSTITTVAGTGTPGRGGLAGPAHAVALNYPTDAEMTPDGRVLVADTYNGYVRILSSFLPGASIDTVAGQGSCDDAATDCSGAPAGMVKLNRPVSVSPLQTGPGFIVAEAARTDNTVRYITDFSSAGTFSTVAGTLGTGGFSGDGGPATVAMLNQPTAVLSTADGGFLIADTNNERIRRVDPSGIITTIAGSGSAGGGGDGGNATAASLNSPSGMGVLPNGNTLIADNDNGLIRIVVNPPLTTINIGSPNGSNGWYIGSSVSVTIKSHGGKGIRCELDPPAPRPAYDALPPDPCPYTGSGGTVTGDGGHTIYAAATNSFGDKEIPVAVSFKLDSQPPTMSCAGKPKFVINDQSAEVSAKVTDSLSGAPAPTVSVPVDTSTLGPGDNFITASDNAGNNSGIDCTYTVVPESFKPAPQIVSKFVTRNGLVTARALTVTRVPAHASVALTCTPARRCPLTHATVKPRCTRRSCAPANLEPLVARRRFKPGAKVTVTVTRADTTGRAFVFTILARRSPSLTTACLAPGSSVPGKGC